MPCWLDVGAEVSFSDWSDDEILGISLDVLLALDIPKQKAARLMAKVNSMARSEPTKDEL